MSTASSTVNSSFSAANEEEEARNMKIAVQSAQQKASLMKSFITAEEAVICGRRFMSAHGSKKAARKAMGRADCPASKGVNKFRYM
jgi:hypothetical protein